MSTGADGLLHARHQAVNILVGYQRAVDDRDLPGVLVLLERTAVSLGGPTVSGTQLVETYRSTLAGGPRTRHLLHQAEVAWAPDGVQVTAYAPYQRYDLDTEPPTLAAIGVYLALFDMAGADVHLTELIVRRDWLHTPDTERTPSTTP